MLNSETSRRTKTTVFDYKSSINWSAVRSVFESENQILNELLDEIERSMEILSELKTPEYPNMIDVEIGLKPEEPNIEYYSAYIYTTKSFLKLLESKKIITNLDFYEGSVKDITPYKFIAAKFIVIDNQKLFRKKAEFVIEEYIKNDDKLANKPHFEASDFVIGDKRLKVLGGYKKFLSMLINTPRIFNSGTIFSQGRAVHRMDIQVKCGYSSKTFNTQKTRLNKKFDDLKIPVKIVSDKKGMFILEVYH